MSAEPMADTIPQDQQTEVSEASTYAIVYERNGDQWGVVGDGWTEVHLYRDTADGTYRIIAWAVSNEEVLMNSNVTAKCKYTKKASDFHKYIDENESVWGFGFYQDENSATKARDFLNAVVNSINSMQSSNGAKPKAMALRTTGQLGVPAIGGGFNISESKLDLMDNPKIALIGPLTIGTAKPAKTSSTKPLPVKISEPIKVVRERHVSFDANSKTFRGLPEEWQEQIINHNFGLPLKHTRSVAVQGYPSDIPAVLVTMKNFLIEHDGLDVVGIFRLAPDASESKVVRDQLDRGVFEGCKDVNCIANCIKIFFRELSKPLLSVADFEEIKKVDSAEDATNLIEKFPEPEKSVFLWLLDLCAEVTANQQVNKMSPQNLAIVIAPNLFIIKDSDDPLASVLVSQKVVQFMYHGIIYRQSYLGYDGSY